MTYKLNCQFEIHVDLEVSCIFIYNAFITCPIYFKLSPLCFYFSAFIQSNTMALNYIKVSQLLLICVLQYILLSLPWSVNYYQHISHNLISAPSYTCTLAHTCTYINERIIPPWQSSLLKITPKKITSQGQPLPP